MQTYLFYDIETTGLNKSFDQVLQFAAIRTDLHLNEIERYELNVKLNCDVIPAPAAVITHHIGVTQASTGISEFDAIKQIHAWLNTPGTISLGYNTLGFDDEFLRFSFYRNLLSPYTHQFVNQCYRMDLYPMAVMYFLFKNSVITWPMIEDKLSLKLEELNNANQLATGRAHNAMVDVEVTLALAQRLLHEKDMWNYVCGYFHKYTDQTRSQITDALMVYQKFGRDAFFQSPVLLLGTHRHYRNQQVWLRLDTVDFNQLTQEALQDYKLVANKKLGEPGFILPLNTRFLQHMNSDRLALADANKKILQQQPELLEKITNYHLEYKHPVFPETDIDASLYLNSFWSREEESFCQRFHQVSAKEKAMLTEKLQNPKLKMLATRILGRHFPDVLTAEQKEVFAEYQQNRAMHIDFRGEKRMSQEMVLAEIVRLRVEKTLTGEQEQLLCELENHLA